MYREGFKFWVTITSPLDSGEGNQPWINVVIGNVYSIRQVALQ